MVAPILESPDFWEKRPRHRFGKDRGLAQAAAVVLPCWIANQQRRLLKALSTGIPVLTTPYSGLPDSPGLTVIPPGDPEALKAAIAPHLESGEKFRASSPTSTRGVVGEMA